MCPECHHTMPSGAKCHSPALRDKAYCYYHFRQRTLAPRPAPAPDEPLNLPNLEDRRDIQVAVSQVFTALGSRRISSRHASRLLYALQIASDNARRMRKSCPAPAALSGNGTPIERKSPLRPPTTNC